MKVIWTEQAFERLAEIEDFIARDDPATAERFINRLIDRAEILSDQPGLGRILPELPRSDLRELHSPKQPSTSVSTNPAQFGK